MQNICTHCQNKGHIIAQCWTLHPTIHLRNLKQDVCRHVPYGEKDSYNSYQDMNVDVGLQKRARTSSSSSPQEGKKYGHVKKHSRYTYSHSQVVYDYVKHEKSACMNGRKSCSYCGLYNH